MQAHELDRFLTHPPEEQNEEEKKKERKARAMLSLCLSDKFLIVWNSTKHLTQPFSTTSNRTQCPTKSHSFVKWVRSKWHQTLLLNDCHNRGELCWKTSEKSSPAIMRVSRVNDPNIWTLFSVRSEKKLLILMTFELIPFWIRIFLFPTVLNEVSFLFAVFAELGMSVEVAWTWKLRFVDSFLSKEKMICRYILNFFRFEFDFFNKRLTTVSYFISSLTNQLFGLLTLEPLFTWHLNS